jgi:predicted MFS family arabinose efflux permease
LPFYVIGAIGVLTALAVYWIVREPKRGETDDLPTAVAPEARADGFFAAIARFFRDPILLMASLASGAGNFITYGLLNFTVLFLMREKGMTLEEVALWYALVIGIGMGGGIYASGRIVDRLARRSKAAYATVPAASLVLALPFFLGFVWAPTWQVAIAFLAVPLFLNSFFLSATVTLVQSEVAPERRVISGALLLLVMNLIGLGFGPTYVGMASDFFRPTFGQHALQAAYYALAPVYLIGALLYLWLARLIRRSLPATP